MNRCIYCQEVMLSNGESGDTNLKASREHIIPAALGGPNSLSTQDVCKGCNSKLGETTDANLMKETVISMLRQQFNLSGYKGKTPDVVLNATSVETNREYKIRIPQNGDVAYNTRPEVSTTKDTDGNEVMTVAGSPAQAAEILKGKLAKLASAGREMQNPDGSLITSIEDSIANAQIEQTTEFKAQAELNLDVIQRGIVKIAFGFAHHVLGPSWTFSPEAQPLRDAAWGYGTPESVAELVKGIKLQFFQGVLQQSELELKARHIIVLLRGNPATIAVSLFGEQLLTMAVQFHVTDEQWEAIFPTSKMMISTPVVGGEIQWGDLMDVCSRISEMNKRK